ncbi:hypothetical protein GW17_00018707 [Ensete ventricosum]|nr:hypothetical protein GW17_00018707 [Ensete ventricosum]
MTLASVRGSRIFESYFDRWRISVMALVADFDSAVTEHRCRYRVAKGPLDNYVGVDANDIAIRHHRRHRPIN